MTGNYISLFHLEDDEEEEKIVLASNSSDEMDYTLRMPPSSKEKTIIHETTLPSKIQQVDSTVVPEPLFQIAEVGVEERQQAGTSDKAIHLTKVV